MTITLIQCWWSVPVLGKIYEDNTEATIKNEQSNETGTQDEGKQD